jgi:DNA polymerase III delta subunit
VTDTPVALPAPVTLVIGPEELLADRAVAAVVDQARGVDPGVVLHDLAAGGLTRGMISELTSPSLFGERTVITVRNVQDAGEELVSELKAYVVAPVEDVSLVLVHKGGVKGKGLLDAARKAGAAEVPAAEVKTRKERLGFVRGEFRHHHRRATEDAVEALLDSVGGDLRALAGACSQLASDTEGVIDVEVVRRYYEGQADATGFSVADRAVEGRTAEALVQLRWALQAGTDPVPLVAALAMALRNLVKVAGAPRGLSQADLARQVGMPPWKIDVVRRQLRGWSADGVASALTAVAEADAAVKGGGVDPVYALERCVITISGARLPR